MPGRGAKKVEARYGEDADIEPARKKYAEARPKYERLAQRSATGSSRSATRNRLWNNTISKPACVALKREAEEDWAR